MGAGWKLEGCDIDGFSRMEYERLMTALVSARILGNARIIVCELIEMRFGKWPQLGMCICNALQLREPLTAHVHQTTMPFGRCETTYIVGR